MVTPSYISKQLEKFSEDPEINQIKDQNAKLQKELLGRQVPLTPSKDPHIESSLQRDPDEDYFMMAVLALKMIHNERYDDTDYCFYISAPALYREVLAHGMPFHQWYTFIENKFEELRQSYVSQYKDNDPEANLMQFQIIH